MRQWLRRFRRRSDDEFAAEVEAHLALETDEQIERGLPAEDARYAALRQFGNVTRHLERFREASPWFWLETVGQDVRFGLRQMRLRPGFTLVAVATLAVGFGANAAVLAMLQAVLFRPLPFKDADRLLVIRTRNPSQGVHDEGLSYANFRDLEIGSGSVVDLAAVAFARATITGDSYPEETTALYAPARFFSVARIQPLLGRTFEPGEERGDVALLGCDVWQRRFGGDRRVLGRTVRVSGVDRVIVGVLPRAVWPGTTELAAKYGDTGVVLPGFADGIGRHLEERFGAGFFFVLGRLRPGVSLDTARARLRTMATDLERAYPVNRGYSLSVDSLPEYTTRTARTPLWLLYGAVCCVLLIACVNVVHLVLARTTGRLREFALRTSLGASRARVVRQLVVESTVLSLTGTAGGLLLAMGGTGILVGLGPTDLRGLDGAVVDWRVVGLTLALGVGVGIMAAAVPAFRAANDRPELLKGRAGGGGAPVLGRGAWPSLIVTEVALSLVLLAAASVMVRSFVRIAQFEWGFNPDQLVAVPLQLRLGTPADGVPAYRRRLLEAVRAVPGVEAVGGIDILAYLRTGENIYRFEIEGRTAAHATEIFIDSVTPGYFSAMQIPVLRGRAIDERDIASASTAIVINETMAARFWPRGDALGKRMRVLNDDGTASAEWWTVVGVVADTRFTGLDLPPGPQVFVSYDQAPSGIVTLVVRTPLEPGTAARSIREAIWRVDRHLPVPRIEALEEVLGRMSAQRRFATELLAIFGVGGLLLAAVGLYGVVSCLVAERTHEIGVRVAVGATNHDVLRLVLVRSLRPVALGLLVGLGGAVLVSRWLRSLLFEVRPADPLALAVAVTALVAVALMAAYVPARRATRVDPVEVLRAE